MKTSKTEIIVLATDTAKPGMETQLERALREVAGPTRQQPGCVQLSPTRRSTSSATSRCQGVEARDDEACELTRWTMHS